MTRVRKLLRSGISVLLAVLMVFGMAATALAAEGTQGDKPTLKYVSLGDSMTTGVGFDDFYLDYYNPPLNEGASRPENGNKTVRGFLVPVEESYAGQLAKKLGEAYDVDWTPLAANAMRIDDIYAVLADDYSKDDYFIRVFDSEDDNDPEKGQEKWFDVFGSRANHLRKASSSSGNEAVKEAFRTAVSEADVITLNAGYNNFGVYVTGRLINIIRGAEDTDIPFLPDYGQKDDDTLQDLLNRINCNIDVDAAKEQIYEIASDVFGLNLNQYEDIVLGNVTFHVADLVDLLLYGYVSYCYYFDKTVSRIYELNPDVTLIVVGMTNTQKGFRLAYGGQVVDIGALYGGLLEMANLYAGALCSNADRYYFVDLSDKNIERFYDALAEGDIDKPLAHRLVEDLCKNKEDKGLFDLDGLLNQALPSMGFLEGCQIKVPVDITVQSAKDAFDSVISKNNWDYQNALNEAVQSLLKAAHSGHSGEDLLPLLNRIIAIRVTAKGDEGYITEDEFIVALFSFAIDPFRKAAAADAINLDNLMALLAEGQDFDSAIQTGLFGDDPVATGAVLGMLDLYTRMVLCNGLMVHPTAKGHAVVANAIYNDVLSKLQNGELVPSARAYTVSKLMKLAAEYVPVYGRSAMEYMAKQIKAADSQYSITNRLLAVLNTMTGSLLTDAQLSLETLNLEGWQAVAAQLGGEFEASYNEACAALAQAAANLTAIAAQMAAEEEVTDAEVIAAINEVKAAVAGLNAAVMNLQSGIKAVMENASGEALESLQLLDNAAGVLAQDVEAAYADLMAEIEKILTEMADDQDDTLEGAVKLAAINAIRNALPAANAAVEQAKAAYLSLLDDVVLPALVEAVHQLNAAIQKLNQLGYGTYSAALANINAALAAIDAGNVAVAINKTKDALAQLNDAINDGAENVRDAVEKVKAAYACVMQLAGQANEEIQAQLAALEAQIEMAAVLADQLYRSATTAPYVIKDDSFYLSLGDSMMTGMGLGTGDADYMKDTWYAGYGHTVPEAYPQVLTEMLGFDYNDKDHHVTLGMGGVRAEDLRFLLDPNVEPDDYFIKRTSGEMVYFGGMGGYGDSLDAIRQTFWNAIQKADLITISIGGNNFGTYLYAQQQHINEYGTLAYDIDFSRFVGEELYNEIYGAIQNYKARALAALAAANVEVDESVLEMLDKACLTAQVYLYAYLSFSTNYAETFNAIRSINPDALLVIVGLYNTLDDLYYSANGVTIGVGALFDTLVKIVNTQFLLYAMQTPNTIFVDVPDVTMFADRDPNRASTNLADGEYYDYMNKDRGIASHPNAEGHQYIAQRIYNALILNDTRFVHVTGITLDKTTLSLKVGQTATLNATVMPENASDKTVTWSSSDPSVATVDDGVVTALKKGTATITATTVDGGKTATCIVTVTSDSTGGGGGGSVGGGGGSSSEKTATAYINGQKLSITVTTSNGNATVKMDPAEIERYAASVTGSEAYLTIDLSELSVASATLSTEIFKKLAELAADPSNSLAGVTIKFADCSVTFDAVAFKAIIEQATGADIKLSVKVNPDLSVSQRRTVGGLNNALVIDVELTSNGKAITDFKGGSVTLEVPFKWSGNVVVRGAFLTDDGKLEPVYRELRNGAVRLVVNHFSKYVVYTEEPLPFTDVDVNAYYYDAVKWAVEKGVTTGTSATTFSPDADCTRAQIVTFLWRAMGSPEPTAAENPFVDVKPEDYFYKAVLWAVEKGITNGTSATTFSPNDSCTRAQTVTFLWRAEGSPEPKQAVNPFADVPADAYYTKAVLWAVEKGVTTGTSATTFSPENTCTRAHVVTFLWRDMGK